jgi:endo-1,4-beta-xylanase
MQDIADGSQVRELVLRTCRLVVGAGPLYWNHVQPSAGTFDFADATRLLAFGKAHRLPVRGHTLVWHEMLPNWVNQRGSVRDPGQILDAHIQAVVGRMRGEVHSWDVVNEPLFPQHGRSDGLRNSVWLQWLGADYIRRALSVARGADPSGTFGINEYGLEGEGETARRKRAAMLRLLQRLLNDGVAVDYLGIQAHLDGQSKFSDAGLGEFLAQVHSMGIRIFVTEMDVNDTDLPSDSKRRDAAVADVYDRFLTSALKGGRVDLVLTWGLSDRNSWMQWHAPRKDGLRQRPLPFDDEYLAKPAWDVLRSHLLVADT